MYYLVLSPKFISNNWDSIKNDEYNNRPDIKSPEEFIAECKRSKVTVGGVQIIIQEELPV